MDVENLSSRLHQVYEKADFEISKMIAEIPEAGMTSSGEVTLRYIDVQNKVSAFLRSALNAQRGELEEEQKVKGQKNRLIYMTKQKVMEEIINKIKFDETIPVMERKRFIDLLSSNNKDNEVRN